MATKDCLATIGYVTRIPTAGETAYPALMLETMQERFMIYGSRSLINWVQKLRTYGKKIRNTTTSLGCIVWSDDGQKLEYKKLEFTMVQLKLFVQQQVELAQDQLHQLLLLHSSEAWDNVVPALDLLTLKDDPSI